MSELNEPQRSAVAFERGPLLIFAGAGSGKTRTITFRIANLVSTHRVPPYRILAVTFTNKAASEMRHRLVSIVGEDIARDLWLGTFHGIAAKVLRRYAVDARLNPNFVIYDDSDQKAVVTRALRDLDLDDKLYPPKQILAMISALKREGHDPAEKSLGDDENLDRIARAYQSALTRSGAVDFDDLLLKLVQLLEDPERPASLELRRKFDHVMVDEFQDTNLVQYRIVRALSANSRNLCVVGDDDQSIYRWRGADVRIIRGFQRDFPEALVVKLEQNYRSTGNIVRAALGVIAKASDREPKELWTAESAGEKVVLRACPDERAEAIFVASSIQKGRARGISSKEQAVFYRIHAQSRVLEEALRGANIPYQIVGGMRFFDRAEIKDMLAYLRLVQNPDSDTDALRVINVPARGIGDKTVSRLLDVAAENTTSVLQALRIALHQGEFNAGTAKKLAAFEQLILDLEGAKDKLSPADLLERIIAQTGYKDVLEKDDSAESDARLENLAELVGSLREYEAEAPETGEAPTLVGYLERVSLVAATDSMEDVAKVSLMTVHSAKGLEFEQVFLTGMEEETFPYRGLDGHDPEELDEERRLAYVAITRARKELFISYAGSRFLFGRTKYVIPSRFLEDIPPDCVKREGDLGRTAYVSSGPSSTYGAGSHSYGGGRREFGGGGFPSSRGGAPNELLSPGGRAGAKSMTIERGGRHIDREAFDDLPFDDAADAPSYEREPVVARAGQKVKHKSFGIGVIERLESGAKPMVVARFPGYGVKRIVADFLEFL